jgi:hypothetical protein
LSVNLEVAQPCTVDPYARGGEILKARVDEERAEPCVDRAHAAAIAREVQRTRMPSTFNKVVTCQSKSKQLSR